MTFDIAAFDTRSRSEAGVAFPILNPKTGAPFLDAEHNPVTITLLGRNSEAFRRIQKEISQRDLDKSSKGIVKSDEEFENERFETLVKMTKGWSFDSLDGTPFPFTPENVRKLWADGRWKWLHVQMMENLLREGNFLALSAGASSAGPSTSSV